MEKQPRVTVFAGHNGSGKTTLAIDRALHEKTCTDAPVFCCDVDVVKPYFRTWDARRLLEEHGVHMIAPELAGTNVDLPTIPGEMNAVFDTPGAISFLDVGGDDAGAMALGQFASRLEETGYRMLLVVNARRYLTRSPGEVLPMIRDMELASGLRFTGIVNNTNLGLETTRETVESSLEFARELSRLTGLPVTATAAEKSVPLDPAMIEGEYWPVSVFRKTEWAIFDV